MRTTLDIDDDVLAVAKELARSERKTIGRVLSHLARKALTPAGSDFPTRTGVPLLPVSANSQRVTSELVKELGDELA